MEATKILTKNQLRTDLVEIRPGMRIKIYERIKEAGKERVTPFEGIVIARKHGKGINATFTVRAVLGGVGVERVFPLHSPNIVKIEVIEKAKVRRAKLYYLRQLSVKKTRKKLKSWAELVVSSEKPSEKVVEEATEESEDKRAASEELKEEIAKESVRNTKEEQEEQNKEAPEDREATAKKE